MARRNPALLDEGGLQSGVVEEEGVHAVEVGAGDFEIDRGARGAPERGEAVEADGGEVGVCLSSEEETEQEEGKALQNVTPGNVGRSQSDIGKLAF